MRRLVGLLVGLVALGAGSVLLLFSVPALQDAVIGRVIARLVTLNADALFADDALRVALCGSSAPLPHPTRAKACVAVFAAGKFWVVDTGPQSWNRLALMRVDGKRIGAIMYTHFHSDHIAELGEFNLQTWGAGRPEPLTRVRPAGRRAPGRRLPGGVRARHRLPRRPPRRRLPSSRASRRCRRSRSYAPPGAKPVVVLEEGGLTITAFSVNHEPVTPAYGYRFDYKGRSVVVSGDTAKSPGLIAAAHGADVLVHEAQDNHLIAMIGDAAHAAGRDRVAKIMHDIPSYHTTPVQAAETANEAGVRLLVMYHLNPPPPNQLAARVFVRGVAEVRPKGWVLGDDGMLVTLPAGSDQVRVTTVQ